eukprot:4336346-Amphidinium_carterae.2
MKVPSPHPRRSQRSKPTAVASLRYPSGGSWPPIESHRPLCRFGLDCSAPKATLSLWCKS